VFQPAVDLRNGRLLGFEALLRWHDGSGESIPPSIVIPRAESMGHMDLLSQWVLSEACVQAARWPPDLQIAVNCSVLQLRRGNAAIAAASAIERSGLKPDRLTVEVTEVSLADDDASADLRVMTRLGILLTVDDVGDDCSVMDRLRDRDVSTVKIEAEVIAGIGDADGTSRNTVRSLVAMARSMGVCTVAEAVETVQQVAALRELGVDTAQGYFFSHPLASADALELATLNPRPTFALSGP
jgi:EAL domain-containing protein (putative c-di-GMP-specific phosphodiesterase class I)